MAQLAHAISALRPAQRHILLAADAIAQAEAHVGRRLLRADERRDIVELRCWSNLDAHAISVAHDADIASMKRGLFAAEHVQRVPEVLGVRRLELHPIPVAGCANAS